MSSEVERFVLQYNVELRDAIDRLEQLNRQSQRAVQAPLAARRNFQEFGRGASDELARIIPGLDKFNGAVRGIGTEFRGAAVAVVALGASITAVMAMRDRYMKQRTQGMDIGVSGTRVEEYQRQFVRKSNGLVDRETSSAELGKFASKLQSAYTDPTRMSAENRQLQLLGVSVGARGQKQTPFNTSLTQLATSFSKMKPADVAGAAKAIGMNQDFALTLAKIGPNIGKVIEQTQQEISTRQNAEKELTKFNSKMAELGETFAKLQNKLGEQLLPSFSSFLDYITRFVELVDRYTPNVEEVKNSTAGQAVGSLIENTSIFGGIKKLLDKEESWQSKAWKKTTGFVDDLFGIPEQVPQTKGQRDGTEPMPSPNREVAPGNPQGQTQGQQQQMNAILDSLDESAREGVETASQMQLAINMFNGAVHTFAGAIDDKQAWAAWAGEVGRGAKLKGASDELSTGGDSGAPSASSSGPNTYSARKDQNGTYTAANGASPPTQKTPYDDLFEKHAKSQGLDPNWLKAIAYVESGMDPNAKSGAGAEGLMQVMPANKKGTGITNSFDPDQNIKAGAQLLKESLKAANGNMEEALKYYHGGNDKKNWGKYTNAYPSKIMGTHQAITNGPLQTVPGNPTKYVEKGADGYDRYKVAPDYETNDARHQALARDPNITNPNKGESRGKVQLSMVQDEIANRLGVHKRQLQHGGVSRGDVEWTNAQLEAGYKNQIFNIKKQLMQVGLPERDRAKLMADLQEQQSGLKMFQNYGAQVAENSREGPRQITVGERAITINLEGVHDPSQAARIMENNLQQNLGQLINGAADGIKY